MANRIVSVHAGIYGMGIYAIMLPSSGFPVAHCFLALPSLHPAQTCVAGSTSPASVCVRATAAPDAAVTCADRRSAA